MPSVLVIYEARRQFVYLLELSAAAKIRHTTTSFVLLLLLLMGDTALSLPPILKIGAIFTTDQKGGSTELAFKYAVHSINNDKVLLPNTRLVYDLTYVPKNDSFHAFKDACRQIRLGVQAVFGPTDPLIGTHIHSVCDALDIPHLECRLDLDTRSKEFSINLYPSQPLLNQAYLDLIKFLNWTRIAVIYEENYGLFKLRELIRTPSSELDIYLRQVNPDNYRRILQGVKQKDIHSLVIDIKPGNMRAFLAEVLHLKMNDYKYHYVFTSFDVDTAHLGDLDNHFINMTGFRLIDSHDEKTLKVLSNIETFIEDSYLRHDKLEILQTEPALMYDSVYAFATGLQALERGHTLMISNVSCEAEVPWNGGLSLINYINSVELRGLTGPIEFKEGRRVQFKLDIIKLKSDEIIKAGEWSPSAGVRITERALFFDPVDMNVTLVVTTILESPFVMMRTGGNYTGNSKFHGFCIDLLQLISTELGFAYELALVPDMKYGAPDPKTGDWNGMVRQLMHHEQPYVMLKTKANLTENITLEGFCIDLLDAIAALVGFDYNISLVPDGKYGVYNYKTGEWNGMVRQLIDKKADLAVGSMTINYARESVIDFTKPFMNLGISILFKVPKSHAARLFSFMNPLALNIWLYILAAYALVSLTILIVARLSPYEWQDPHPCSVANSVVVNPFSLGNCFWFTVGTLMQQGSDLNPKATSTRIVGATWWFFTLIIISSYTANLAAFLTVERMITPIENAEDLAAQTEIPYGTLESGSTMTFFRDSMIETYKKMWRFMDSKKPSVFVSTYEEGIQRVLDGKYAFLMESTMLDYIVQRDCNLIQIGGLLDNKGYGIGTPMGSPWRDKISLAILELQEKGEIQILYDKWWKKSTSLCVRAGKESDTKANSLGVVNIGGIFIVLLAGLGVAVLVAIFEFCYYSKYAISTDKRGGTLPQQSLFQEMAAEFCFAMRCRGSRQRPAFKSQCSKCISDSTYLPSGLELPLTTEDGPLSEMANPALDLPCQMYRSVANVRLPDGKASCNDI